MPLTSLPPDHGGEAGASSDDKGRSKDNSDLASQADAAAQRLLLEVPDWLKKAGDDDDDAHAAAGELKFCLWVRVSLSVCVRNYLFSISLIPRGCCFFPLSATGASLLRRPVARNVTSLSLSLSRSLSLSSVTQTLRRHLRWSRHTLV